MVRLIIGAVLTGVTGLPFVILLALVISSAVGASSDPHGYSMIFGTVFAFILFLPLILGILLLISGLGIVRADRDHPIKIKEG